MNVLKKKKLSKRKFAKKMLDWYFDDSCQDGVDLKILIYKSIKFGEQNTRK